MTQKHSTHGSAPAEPAHHTPGLDALPSCPFIHAPHCPYTEETAGGCPYHAMVKDKAIQVPEYCPILK